MLSIPVSENKTKEQQGKTESETEMDGYRRSGGWVGYGLLSPGSGRLSASSQQAAMQKAYGNQAMLRKMERSPGKPPVKASPLSQGGILQRKCACGNAAGSSGSCAECQKNGEMAPLEQIQTKLTINQPGDRYEQEADLVAEQVMSMPDAKPSVQREAMPEKEEEIQTKTLGNSIQHEAMPEEEEEIQTKPLGSIQREAMPKEKEEIQTKRSPDAGFQAGSNLESRLNASQGGGSPLPDEVRSFMEPRFGSDFRDVRVHTGSDAIQMNQELGAQAFTHRKDIYFGSGKSPGRNELTAHELTHVLQQYSGSLARQPAPAAPSPQTAITAANTRRIGTLLFVLSELSDVISAVQLGLDPNPYDFTVQAIQNWLFVSPGDATFLATVQAAQRLFVRNLTLTPRLLYQSNTVQVDPFGNACPTNYAYSRGGQTIYFCDNFLAKNTGCQTDVMIHEHFHLVFNSAADLYGATTTAQALTAPDSLAQMASEIVNGPDTHYC